MTRTTGIVLLLLLSLAVRAQGDQQVRSKADAFFNEKSYAEALPLYSQLVSLAPTDRVLNYKFGTCLLFGGTDKGKAIGHLKFATQDPSIPPDAWYWLGRAYHLDYQFKDALTAYQRYQGTGSKKELEGFPIAALDKQCRNGMNLLSNLKEISVHGKIEADDAEFFRFYELGDIGGRIVVLPDELKTTLDKKSKRRALVYLPAKGGAIYYASYGKEGKTGLDIYRTEVLTNGTFAAPVKLAGYVNTDQDEDFAFMHPDGRSFYFSSKGHNSMGGYDVFRSPYDKTSETFGPAENLDFAVNTPDDDLFYITDAENKLACFASGRSSVQGKLHVYRVSTAQVPVVVTVMKGTFANAMDGDDRAAHIMVEDPVTRERVADVRTDINGTYVLALPRSGRFKYVVECGEAGRTHTAEVEVPRASAPRAYRQEIELVRRNEAEQIVVRNYFDSPVEEDMIGLMLEEIKRRARLDVTGDRPGLAQQPATTEPKGDLLTQAGFAGDMTEAEAIRLAKDDAQRLQDLAQALAGRAAEAFAIANDASIAAEQAARTAATAAEKATAETNEEQRNDQMRDAAQRLQRSRTAHLRARAAYSAAQQMEQERMAVTQQSVAAKDLATDLERTMAAKQQEATLKHLRSLKERLDTRSGPNGELDLAERTRRALVDQEKEAARLLSVATAKRTEETELADRVERAKREHEVAKGKSKKDELARTIAEQEQQLAYLRAEVLGAFTKAREYEATVAVARGERSLINHLSAQPTSTTGVTPGAVDRAGLAQRIANNGNRIEAIPVDARYDGNFAEPASAMEARSFDWRINGVDAVLAASAMPTQRLAGDVAKDAVYTNGRTTTIPARTGIGEPLHTEVSEVPISHDADLANAAGNIGEVPQRSEAESVTPTSSQSTATNGVTETRTTAPANSGTEDEARADAVERMEAPPQSVQEAPFNGMPLGGVGVTSDAQARTGTGTNERVEVANGVDTTAHRAEVPEASVPDEFLIENEKNELRQAIAAERNTKRREELTARLEALEQREQASIVANDQGKAESELTIEGVDMQRMPITFFPNTKEADIITLLYPAYERDKARLGTLTEPVERADGLSGLELMLADSLRGEMVRQAAILELAPQQATIVLPKIDRLRVMRQQRILEAERIANDAEAAAQATELPREGLARTASRQSYAEGQNPITDRFIYIPHDPQEVYASKVEHRSPEVSEAVAAKEGDLERMRSIDLRIDSLEAAMVDLPRKEYDRKRREADRLIDERMIIRSDLGQRSAYLTKEEWRTTTDSLKTLEKQVASLGLAPDENLLLLSEGMRTSANTRFAEATSMRKKADRTEDIMLRDSLFRTAYSMELDALNEMDKAVTVKSYLVGTRFTRGESLAYEEVARRVLHIADGEEPALASAVNTNETTNTMPATEVRDAELVPQVVVPAEDIDTDRATAMQPDQESSGATETNVDLGTMVALDRTTDGTAINEARKTASTMADLREQALPGSARVPLELYENFLKQESVMLKIEALDPALDPDLLFVRKEQTVRESAALEQRSLELADRATALEDSIATARKRDRERLEAMALRTRQEADSLHERSLATAEQARDLELRQRDAQQAKQLRDRLTKYYYLSSEEQAMVLDDADMSRYFQMKARALEQLDAAADADASAGANRRISELLRKEADGVKDGGATGIPAGAETIAKHDVLQGRAQLLASRADSLNDIAARLRGAANINESQAGVLLQGMTAERSTDWMALEMRTRRTEALLAQEQPNTPLRPSTPASTQNQVDNRASDTVGADPAIQPSRSIAPPFGTDSRQVRPAIERPIAELPATVAPAMVIPEVLVNDVFAFRTIGERVPVAIPMDAPLPAGIIFKVQIGAFRSPLSEEVFSDMTPVMGEHTPNGFIRYTAGLFTGFQQAASAKDRVRDRGYRDAFVVAYRDGVRISLGEAMREARAAEQAALVSVPTNASPTMTTSGSPTGTGGIVHHGIEHGGTTAPALERIAANTVLEPVRTTTVGSEPMPVLVQRPLSTPVAMAPALSTEQLLAKYPASADSILGTFTAVAGAATYYNVPGAAPAAQVETIKGLFYTVQVGVYSKPVALDKLFNLTELNSERTETAKIRYTTGRYSDTEQARTRKEVSVARGVKDAFITAYLNGKRIPMQEAAALLQRFGPAILAVP